MTLPPPPLPLSLPVPPPPADDVAELLELLGTARAQLDGARRQLDRARALAAYGPEPQMTVRVLVGTRTRAVELWAAELAALEDRAHTLGLL